VASEVATVPIVEGRVTNLTIGTHKTTSS
jgi:hypothetical protein